MMIVRGLVCCCILHCGPMLCGCIKETHRGVFIPMMAIREETYGLPEIGKETMIEREGTLKPFEAANGKEK